MNLYEPWCQILSYSQIPANKCIRSVLSLLPHRSSSASVVSNKQVVMENSTNLNYPKFDLQVRTPAKELEKVFFQMECMD